MAEISKNMAYLKGLAEGLKLSEKSDEGKVIEKLIDVLGAAAEKIDELEKSVAELSNDMALIDDDIYALFGDVDDIKDSISAIEGEPPFEYVDDDDMEPFYDDEDEGYDEDEDDLFDLYDEDDDLFEIQCPECGDDVVVDFEMLDEENNIVCPHCHQKIDLMFDIPDEDDDDEQDEIND